MKEKVIVKWTGAEPTSIRKSINGERYPINPGETMEVDKDYFEMISRAYKQIVLSTSVETQSIKKSTIETQEVKPKKTSKKK